MCKVRTLSTKSGLGVFSSSDSSGSSSSSDTSSDSADVSADFSSCISEFSFFSITVALKLEL